MATTTTNFGWDIPQSTDLVKDGATAIAALGQDIDTALIDLKGGTTGQVLSKASNTDLDYTWVTDAAGDITGVTAGTGISGGGTSGTVTVTNSMATAITTAGDLIKGTGSGTFDRLGIGSTGQVLTVAAGAPSWATPAGGSTFSGALVGNTGSTTVANNTTVVVNWATETFDTDGYHSTSTNTSRITIPTGKAGYFQVGAVVQADDNTTGIRRMNITKNGTNFKSVYFTPSASNPSLTIDVIISVAEADYLEVSYFQNSGSTQPLYQNNTDGYFYANYIGA
jgi:hypothetical protein